MLAAAFAALPSHADTPGATTEPPASAPAPSWPRLADPDSWTLQVQPRLWYVSPAGKLALPSTTAQSQKVRIENFDLDSPQVSAFGEIALRGGPWRFAFSGAHYSEERSTTAGGAFQIGSAAVAAGNLLNSRFEYSTAQLSVAYRLYEHDFSAADGSPGRTVLRLDPLLGVRFHDVDIEVTRVTPTVVTSRADPFYAEIYAGARAELQVIRDFSIDLELSAGGLPVEDSIYSVDVAVGFTWRPVEALGVQIGWRQLLVSMEEDEGLQKFEYDGTLAGLYAGLTIRF